MSAVTSGYLARLVDRWKRNCQNMDDLLIILHKMQKMFDKLCIYDGLIPFCFTSLGFQFVGWDIVTDIFVCVCVCVCVRVCVWGVRVRFVTKWFTNQSEKKSVKQGWGLLIIRLLYTLPSSHWLKKTPKIKQTNKAKQNKTKQKTPVVCCHPAGRQLRLVGEEKASQNVKMYS